MMKEAAATAEEHKKISDFEKKFISLQQKCDLKDFPDLQSYLANCKDNLSKLIEEHEAELEKKREEVVRLKMQAEIVKTGGDQPEDETQDTQGIRRMSTTEDDEAQVVSQRNKPEDKKLTYQELIKRNEQLVANAISLTQRLCVSVKDGSQVQKTNLMKKLSLCGLRLEHMWNIILQKKPYFSLESINKVSTLV